MEHYGQMGRDLFSPQSSPIRFRLAKPKKKEERVY